MMIRVTVMLIISAAIGIGADYAFGQSQNQNSTDLSYLRPQEVAQQFLDAYNAHNVNRLMKYLSPDVVAVAPDLTVVNGAELNKRYFAAWFSSVPDVHDTIKSLTTGSDRFVLEVVETGTYTRRMPSAGAPPAYGQKLHYPYVMVAMIKHGQISVMRLYEDDLVVERQLGVRP